MRIGINAHKLYTSQNYHNAGISRYVQRLIWHLARADTAHHFVLSTNEQLRRWEGLEGPRLTLHSTRWPTTRPVVRVLWEQLVQPWASWSQRLDLLHCPLNVIPLVGSLPCILTVHDLSFEHFPHYFHPIKQRYLAAFTRLSARRAAHVLADSGSTRDDLVQMYGVPASRITVVYPGLDPDFAPVGDQREVADFRTRRGLDHPYALYLGTLEPRKNVDRLVQAFAALIRGPGRGLPHRLVLAGGKGWGYQAIFRAIEDAGIEDRVILPGYVPRAEQRLWYNAADLFVYPSQYEGFGFPVLEAMACGAPVITTSASSLPEVVGAAGCLVPPGDTAALAEAMWSLLSQPNAAAALRARGQAQAARFRWDTAAATCLAVYERLGAGEQQPCPAP